jgi:NNP family nitrate/nitrite transporter-like MFS transporter
MTLSGFRKAGHTPTLLASFLYFDVSFMVWVILGPLGPFIGDALKLTATQKGFLIALPLLAGSFFRPIMGLLADRIGGRKTGLIGLALTLIPLIIGWQFASTLSHFYLIGLMLGISGASFAVALPLASRWYPAEYQGLAMGIAGAGNSGTLLATLFAPRLATALGFHGVFAIALIPVVLVMIAFALLAKDSPKHVKVSGWSDYSEVLRETDTAWFCMMYCMTFGSFVGLASFLTVFFHDQYGLAKVAAGDFTTVAVLAGSFLRPVGGMISDRIGGYKLLLVLLVGVSLCLGAIGFAPPVNMALVLLILAMGMLGMGNGAVFQMLPQRFPTRVGILTGIVGAAGGVGGFLLPSMLGAIKDRTGQYGFGFVLCAAAILAGALMLLHLGHGWLESWGASSADRVGLFSYRGFGKPQTDVTDLAA